MRLAFVVKPEYEGVGGTVMYGVDGESLELSEELAKHESGNTIVTDDVKIQSALRHLHGATGPVFDVHAVDDEGNMSEEELPTISTPQNLTTRSRKRKAAKTGEQHTPTPIEAEHGGSGSGYEGLTDDELKQELQSRGVEVAEGSSTAELVEALEQNDAQKEASSGS